MVRHDATRTSVAVCYDVQDDDTEYVDMLRLGLTESGVNYVDIYRDGVPGRPEVTQIETMMREALWIVIIFRDDVIGEQFQYLLAVIVEILKSSRCRNVVSVGNQNFIPAWLSPFSDQIITPTKSEWVKDVVSITRKSPWPVNNYDILYTFDKKDLTICNPSYLSDPNPMSSEDEDDVTRHYQRHKSRRLYMKHRRQLVKPYRNPATGNAYPVKVNDFMSVLQEWAWNSALMTCVVGPHDNSDNFVIKIHPGEVRVMKPFFNILKRNSQENTFFDEIYDNATDHDANHEIREGRQFESSVNVKIKKGITLSGITLEVPESIATDTSDFQRGVDIVTSDDKRLIKRYAFRNDMLVPGCHAHRCRLSALERISSWKFTATVAISGQMDVTMMDKRGKIVMDIKPELHMVLDKIRKQNLEGISVQDGTALVPVSGHVDFRYVRGVKVDIDKTALHSRHWLTT